MFADALKRVGPLLLIALGLAAPAAHAGTYNVTACGETKVNESWTGVAVRGAGAKATCSGGNDDPMLVQQAGSVAMDPGTVASLNFTVPPGLALVDWKIERIWTMLGNATSDFNRPFVMYVFNGEPFAGGGHYFAGKTNELAQKGAWANPPEGDFNLDREKDPIKKQSFVTSQGFGPGSSFSVRVGCVGDKRCKNGGSGNATNGIRKAIMTIEDTTPPALAVEQSGLLAPGPHNGNDPVTLSASDASGIASVEIISRVDPASEFPTPLLDNLNADPSPCSGARIKACPDVPTQAFPAQLSDAGTYPVLVRATDRAGNQTVAGPYTVTITEPAEPADPSQLNGDGVSGRVALSAGFGAKLAPTTSVRFGRRAPVAGRLVNGRGAGIANALLAINTRDLFGSGFEQRGTVRTGPDGGFLLRLRTPVSRTVRIVWRRNKDGSGTLLRSELKLDVRAFATLRKPRGVRRGRTFTLRGQVQGRNPRKGVRLRAQVKRGRTWRTLRTGRAGKEGRYALRVRLGAGAKVRVQVRGRSNWPYRPGATRTVRVPVR